MGFYGWIQAFITKHNAKCFLFQHDCAPAHKARSIKTWIGKLGVEQFDWHAQSPDHNLTEHTVGMN